MGRDLLGDIAFGLRSLLRRPGFTVTAVGVLALGIGASTGVISLVDGLFFQRPGGVSEPHRLLRLHASRVPGQGSPLQNPDYRYYRREVGTLSGLAAWDPEPSPVRHDRGDGQIDQVEVGFVSDNFFDVLGTRPLIGREFVPQEDARPGVHPVAVLSHGFWERAFGAETEVLGRAITLNGDPYEVVGVMPPGFRALTPTEDGADVWVPTAMRGALLSLSGDEWWERRPGSRTSWLSVVGRLAPGSTFEAAESEIEALAATLAYEGRDPEEGVLVSRQFLYRPSELVTLERLSLILGVAVTLVLAVAIANVALLLLSRAGDRDREIAIRSAMGAGRGRLIRQLLAETLLVGLAGGGSGLVLAWVGVDLADSLLPVAVETDLTPDAGVAGIAVGVSILVTLLVGLVPAVRLARTSLTASMHRGPDTRRIRAQGLMVISQLALSTTLVAGALLFGRSFWAAQTEPLGFTDEDRLLLRLDLAAAGYGPADTPVFLDRVLERLDAVPGVAGATVTSMLPFRGRWQVRFEPPPGSALAGTASVGDETAARSGMNVVGRDYFDVMGIELVRGRPLGSRDREGATDAVVINRTLAERLWPGGDALGETLSLRDRAFTVVGVAETSTYFELGEEPSPHLWVSALQFFEPSLHLVVETDGPPMSVSPAVQNALREIDPHLVFGWTSTLQLIVDDVTARYEVMAVVVGVFGSLALFLAATGLYGLVTLLVTRRTREFGIRMALGAGRRRVAGAVVGRALSLAAVGLIIGLGCAAALREWTRSLVYGVEPSDPRLFLATAVALTLTALLASLAPARRAVEIDPIEAIRAD